MEMLGLDNEDDVISHLDYYEIPYLQKHENVTGEFQVCIGRIMDSGSGNKAKRKELIKEDHRALFPPKLPIKLVENNDMDWLMLILSMDMVWSLQYHRPKRMHR